MTLLPANMKLVTLPSAHCRRRGSCQSRWPSAASRATQIGSWWLTRTASWPLAAVAALVQMTVVGDHHDRPALLLIGRAGPDRIEQSRRLAASVQRSLYGTLAADNPGLRDRGVKEASYVVLTETAMPGILAEVSFVSSPTDEQKLRSDGYREQIAEALGVYEATVRQARLDESAKAHRKPPEGWEATVARLAKKRAERLYKLAEQLGR